MLIKQLDLFQHILLESDLSESHFMKKKTPPTTGLEILALPDLT